MLKVSNYDNLKKAAMAESTKSWLDEWVWKEFWGLLNELAVVDPSKLLDVQAKARVLLNLYKEVKQDIANGKTSEDRLKNASLLR